MARPKNEGSEKLKTTTIQVEPKQWQQVKVKAAEDNLTIRQVLKSLLNQWLSGNVEVKKND